MSHNNRCNRTPVIFRFYKHILIGITILLILTSLYRNSSLFYRKNLILPFSLHLNRQELYLIKGEEFRLYVFGLKKHVSYSSTNFRVAGVNFNGRVFAYQTGKAFIIAKVKDKELKCRVYVIDLNKKTLVLKQGNTYRLNIKGTNSYTRWTSKDKHIATVNAFGKVTAKSKGRTVIYAKVKGRTLKCTVWVR